MDRDINRNLGCGDRIDDHLLQIIAVASDLAIGVGVGGRLVLVKIRSNIGVLRQGIEGGQRRLAAKLATDPHKQQEPQPKPDPPAQPRRFR